MKIQPPESNVGNIIQVKGMSMAPYVQSDECLLWNPTDDYQRGDLVVFSNLGAGPEFIVHRFLGQGLSKGDHEKWTDQDSQRMLRPVGRVVARLGQENPSAPTPIRSRFWLGQALTFFAEWNTYKKPVFHRLAGGATFLLGHCLRQIEKWQTYRGES